MIEATDRAVEVAQELGVDISTLKGTGVGGRVLVKDVRQSDRTRENAPQRHYHEEEVVEAIRQSRGYISVAAKKLGCSHQTIRNWIDRSEACSEAIIEARTIRGDFFETALENRVRAGSDAAIIFGLKTLYKDRGYVEKTEHHFTGEETIGLEIVAPEDTEEDNS